MRAVALVLVLLASGCLNAPSESPATETTPSPTPGAGAGTWKLHKPDPLPRYELAVAQVGARVFVIGGLRATAVMSSTVEVYDAQNDTWSLGPEYPGPVHHHAAVATPDGTVLSFGGWIGIGQSATDLAFRLLPGSTAWTPIAPMPRARGAHAAALVEGRVWLIGGTDVNGQLLKPIDVYDPATNTYARGPDLPQARDHLAAVVLDQRLFVLGGRERTLQTTTQEVQVFDLAGKNWSVGAPLTMPRGGFGAAVHNGTIYAMGGEDADTPRLKNQAEVYDPVAETWTQIAPMQRARTGLGAAVWQDRVFAIGGADPSGAPNSDAPESFRAPS